MATHMHYSWLLCNIHLPALYVYEYYEITVCILCGGGFSICACSPHPHMASIHSVMKHQCLMDLSDSGRGGG